MPLFGLIPDPVHIHHPDWAASLHRGPCYVVAPDERRARLFAASALANPDAPLTDAGLRPASPWTRCQLTRRQATLPPVILPRLPCWADEEGAVLIPAAEDASGALLRLVPQPGATARRGS